MSNKTRGIGITDISIKDADGNKLHSYELWSGILGRCYSKSRLKTYPANRGLSVCEEWLTFSNFKRYYDKHYRKGTLLNRSILKPDNRIYSPEHCRFVPTHVHRLLACPNSKETEHEQGVYLQKGKLYTSVSKYGKKVTAGPFDTKQEAYVAYKASKENYVQEVAYTEYAAGRIDVDVYHALVSWRL